MTDHQPTSPQQYLQDTLYAYKMLHELAGADTEPAVIAGQLIARAMVFTDANSGNRVDITALPDDQADFIGATVAISGADRALNLPELRDEHVTAAVFVVAEDGRVFMQDATLADSKAWKLFPTGALARALDMPQSKPVATWEEDPRQVPPVLVRALPDTTDPKRLFEFYDVITKSDILPVPHDQAYTQICALLDESKANDIPELFGRVIIREGLLTTEFKDHLFSLELRESLPTDPDDGYELDFERVFNITFNALNGPTVFAAYKLGVEQTKENLWLINGETFDFKLTRRGLIAYGYSNDKKVTAVLHPHAESMLYRAILASDTFGS